MTFLVFPLLLFIGFGQTSQRADRKLCPQPKFAQRGKTFDPDLQAPTDGVVFSNDIEQVLLGRLTATRDCRRDSRQDRRAQPASRIAGG